MFKKISTIIFATVFTLYSIAGSFPVFAETEKPTLNIGAHNIAVTVSYETNEGGSVTDMLVSDNNGKVVLNDLYEYAKTDNVRATEIKEKINYCNAILPEQITEAQIIEYLTTNNIEKNIGVCMKTLKAQFGSNLDGKMAQGIVKEYISK